MKLPTSIKITCLVDGKPTPGLFVDILVKLRHKNPVNFAAGPSDERGELFVSEQQIVQKAQWATATFPMDYTGIADFSGEIGLTPEDQDALRRTLRGYERYRSTYPFPPQFADQVQASLASLDQISPAVLSLRCEHDGEDVTIHTDAVEI